MIHSLIISIRAIGLLELDCQSNPLIRQTKKELQADEPFSLFNHIRFIYTTRAEICI